MFNITVTDNETAKQTFRNYDVVISLRSNPNDVGFEAPVHHIECFGDIIANRDNGPKLENIQNIVDFFDNMLTVQKYVVNVYQFEQLEPPKDLKFLIHCRAGISRSTAVAAGLLVLFGNRTPYQALEEIYEQRGDIMWPNDLVLEHFQHLIDLKDPSKRLDRTAAKWKGEKTMLKGHEYE